MNRSALVWYWLTLIAGVLFWVAVIHTIEHSAVMDWLCEKILQFLS